MKQLVREADRRPPDRCARAPSPRDPSVSGRRRRRDPSRARASNRRRCRERISVSPIGWARQSSTSPRAGPGSDEPALEVERLSVDPCSSWTADRAGRVRRRARPRPPRRTRNGSIVGYSPRPDPRHVPSRNDSAVRSGWTSGSTEPNVPSGSRATERRGIRRPRSRRSIVCCRSTTLVSSCWSSASRALELRDATFGGDGGIVGEQRSGDPNRSGPIVDVGRTPREVTRVAGRREAVPVGRRDSRGPSDVSVLRPCLESSPVPPSSVTASWRNQDHTPTQHGRGRSARARPETREGVRRHGHGCFAGHATVPAAHSSALHRGPAPAADRLRPLQRPRRATAVGATPAHAGGLARSDPCRVQLDPRLDDHGRNASRRGRKLRSSLEPPRSPVRPGRRFTGGRRRCRRCRAAGSSAARTRCRCPRSQRMHSRWIAEIGRHLTSRRQPTALRRGRRADRASGSRSRADGALGPPTAFMLGDSILDGGPGRHRGASSGLERDRGCGRRPQLLADHTGRIAPRDPGRGSCVELGVNDVDAEGFAANAQRILAAVSGAHTRRVGHCARAGARHRIR